MMILWLLYKDVNYELAKRELGQSGSGINHMLDYGRVCLEWAE